MPTPQSTKPSANTHVPGNSTHRAKAAAARAPDAASMRRREVTSAQAPEGTSRTSVVTDHSANSAEIAASERPWSAKSSA